jgi:hypothetical protein
MTIIKGGRGTCDLTGRDEDGVYVRLDNGATLFLSWKALKQQVALLTKSQVTSDDP